MLSHASHVNRTHIRTVFAFLSQLSSLNWFCVCMRRSANYFILHLFFFFFMFFVSIGHTIHKTTKTDRRRNGRRSGKTAVTNDNNVGSVDRDSKTTTINAVNVTEQHKTATTTAHVLQHANWELSKSKIIFQLNLLDETVETEKKIFFFCFVCAHARGREIYSDEIRFFFRFFSFFFVIFLANDRSTVLLRRANYEQQKVIATVRRK